MLHGCLPLAERCGEHAEVAIGSTVARDPVADHHVPARVRHELRVEERGHAPCPTAAAASARYVSDASQRRVPERVEPASLDPAELLACLVVHPELGEESREARGPGAPGAVADCQHA